MKNISRLILGLMLIVLALGTCAAVVAPINLNLGNGWFHFGPGASCFAVSDHNVCTAGYACVMPPTHFDPTLQTIIQTVGNCQPNP